MDNRLVILEQNTVGAKPDILCVINKSPSSAMEEKEELKILQKMLEVFKNQYKDFFYELSFASKSQEEIDLINMNKIIKGNEELLCFDSLKDFMKNYKYRFAEVTSRYKTKQALSNYKTANNLK